MSNKNRCAGEEHLRPIPTLLVLRDHIYPINKAKDKGTVKRSRHSAKNCSEFVKCSGEGREGGGGGVVPFVD